MIDWLLSFLLKIDNPVRSLLWSITKNTNISSCLLHFICPFPELLLSYLPRFPQSTATDSHHGRTGCIVEKRLLQSNSYTWKCTHSRRKAFPKSFCPRWLGCGHGNRPADPRMRVNSNVRYPAETSTGKEAILDFRKLPCTNYITFKSFKHMLKSSRNPGITFYPV